MRSPRSANIKLVLFIAAVCIVVATLLYTRAIVEQLLAREREVADLYARSLEFVANSPADQVDYGFIFNEVIRSIDFPMVLSDNSNQPLQPYYTNARNTDLDTTASQEEQHHYLAAFIRELDRQNPPIRVRVAAGTSDTIFQHVHYGESRLVTRLRWLPYLEIGVAGMFIILGYVGFSYIKRNEQSNIWVGMAKETAHQLGTPLSSLMGWVEILKSNAAGEPRQLNTIAEMESDLQRLQVVADRFSKIGSKPVLKEEDIHAAIDGVIRYFRRRLPSRLGEGSHIDIAITSTVHPVAPINRELFGWVIENLIKNAVDAMPDGSGSIHFALEDKGSAVTIDVRDTGKGIDLKSKQDIFRPGYSTKQRGWGLGLSLSKRIIETYHRGKIVVKESRPGKGTTFRIRLPK